MRRIKTYKKWSIWRLTAAEAIKMGLSRDGGLLTPEVFPKLTPALLEDLRGKTYGQRDEPEWAADSVQELIDFIDSYET